MIANRRFDDGWRNDGKSLLFELCPRFCCKHVTNRYSLGLNREHIPKTISRNNERIIGTVVRR